MAFTSLRASGEFQASTSAATATLSPSTNIEVGDLIWIGYTGNTNILDISTCVDNSSEPGTANSYIITNPYWTAATHTLCSIYMLKATRKILTSNVITITWFATASRRAAQLMAFVPGNANPARDVIVGFQNDNTSPVAIPTTGTLAQAASLVIVSHAWRGGAVASGISPTPAVGSGWVACPGGGALSGGTTTRVEQNTYYNLNVGATTAIAATATYSTISMAEGETTVFNDVALPAADPRPRIILPRRAWAGR